MRISSAVAGGLVVAGTAVLAVSTIRSAVLWIVEPGSEYVAPVGALLLGAGIVVLALRSAVRPVVSAGALLLAGVASGVLMALVAAVTARELGSGLAYTAYGPGTPPSFSWMLLASQVVAPALQVLAIVLVVAAVARFGVLLRSTATRRLRAE